MISDKIYNAFVFLIFVFSFQSCSGHSAKDNNSIKIDTSRILSDTLKTTYSRRDTTINTNFKNLKAPTTIKYADSSVGTILVLPGWNYSDTEWCSKTILCKEAKKKHFNLVFVEMQRSVYLKEYYKETRKDYSIYPTRSWLIDSVIIPCFKSGLIDSSKNCFVMGLSTGGRGSAILALEHPEIFKACATLSGDFCPSLQKDDALMINSLGPYSKFASRWEGDNDIVRRINSFNVPVYIGHGLADKVCPPLQSKNFESALKKAKPNLEIKSHYPLKDGHNYSYWNSEIIPVLDFFLEHIQY